MYDRDEYTVYCARAARRIIELSVDQHIPFAGAALTVYREETGAGMLSCTLLLRRCRKIADENTRGKVDHAVAIIVAFVQQTYLLKVRHGVNAEIAREMLQIAETKVDEAFTASAARTLRTPARDVRVEAAAETAVYLADMRQQKEDERELAREGTETVSFLTHPDEAADINVEWTYDFPTMRGVSGWWTVGGTYGLYGHQTKYLLRRTANGEWLLKADRFRKFGFEKVQLSAEEAPWERAEENERPGGVSASELEWHSVPDEHLVQVENGYQLYLRLHTAPLLATSRREAAAETAVHVGEIPVHGGSNNSERRREPAPGTRFWPWLSG